LARDSAWATTAALPIPTIQRRIQQLESEQVATDVAARNGSLRVQRDLHQIVQQSADCHPRIAAEFSDDRVDFLVGRVDNGFLLSPCVHDSTPLGTRTKNKRYEHLISRRAQVGAAKFWRIGRLARLSAM